MTLPHRLSKTNFDRFALHITRFLKSYPKDYSFSASELELTQKTAVARLRDALAVVKANTHWLDEDVRSIFALRHSDIQVLFRATVDTRDGVMLCSRQMKRCEGDVQTQFLVPPQLRFDFSELSEESQRRCVEAVLVLHHYRRFTLPSVILTSVGVDDTFYDVSVTKNPDNTYTIL